MGAIPPLPKARPASRYSGMEENPQRLERRARTARPTETPPSSMKSLAKSGACVVSGASYQRTRSPVNHWTPAVESLHKCSRTLFLDSPKALLKIHKSLTNYSSGYSCSIRMWLGSRRHRRWRLSLSRRRLKWSVPAQASSCRSHSASSDATFSGCSYAAKCPASGNRWNSHPPGAAR